MISIFDALESDSLTPEFERLGGAWKVYRGRCRLLLFAWVGRLHGVVRFLGKGSWYIVIRICGRMRTNVCLLPLSVAYGIFVVSIAASV